MRLLSALVLGKGRCAGNIADRPRRPKRLWILLLLFLIPELLYFLPMARGWHSVPFHLFNKRYTGVKYHRTLPRELEHMPGNDATAVLMDYPDQFYTAEKLRKGDMPWWNPEVGMGRAWIGNGQVFPFSPLLLPFLLHPNPWTYSLQFLLGSIVCLLAAYCFFRLLDIPVYLAAAGAALWTWNPFTAASYIMSSVWAYWWFPLAMVGLLYALKRKRWEGWVVCSAGFSLMILCGQPETALLLGETAAGFFLVLLSGRVFGDTKWRWLAGGLVSALLLAALLGAAQWVPLLEVLKDAVWYKSQNIIEAVELTHPIASFFSPLSGVFLQPILWGAAALTVSRRPRWEAVGFGATLLFLLGFTSHAIAATIPYRLLRLGGLIPSLHGAELACVPAAGLAVLGLGRLLKRRCFPSRTTLLFSALLSSTLTIWSLYLLLPWEGVSRLPAIWLVFELGLFIWLLLSPYKISHLVAIMLVLMAVLFPLASKAFRYPYFSGSPQPDWGSVVNAPSKARQPPPRFWAQSSPMGYPSLAPNLNLLVGASDLRSSSVLNPPGSDVFSHGWGAGGYISYIVYTFERADPKLLTFLGVSRAVVANRGAGSIFRIFSFTPGPRAFFAPFAEFDKNDPSALKRFKHLLKEGRAYTTAVVDSPPPEPVPNFGRTVGGGLREAPRIEWLSYSPEALKLRVKAPSDGVVVLLESFDHLWRVKVDGRPTPVLRTDLTFRGVIVKKGEHVLDFFYDVKTMKLAMLLSLLGWLFILPIMVIFGVKTLGCRRKYNNKES